MRIAILTSGTLPIPAVQGGAVENLIDFCLDYNDRHQIYDITVYSVYDRTIKKHPARNSNVNHYRYIKTSGYVAKILKGIYHKLGRGEEYYHYSVEYFLERVLWDLRKRHFDIIIVENRPGYALKLIGKTTAKLVLHQENDYLNNQTPHYKMIYESFDLIINTSSYITRRVHTINPNDSKCKTVLNGIDTKSFYCAKPFSRQLLGFDDKILLLFIVADSQKKKGFLS